MNHALGKSVAAEAAEILRSVGHEMFGPREATSLAMQAEQSAWPHVGSTRGHRSASSNASVHTRQEGTSIAAACAPLRPTEMVC